MKTPSKTHWISMAGAVMVLAAGCQCCPLFDHYADAVDEISDHHVYFDRVYNPKFDITRMGKPDWCSPFNRFFCKRCCNNGCYDRFDDDNLYPPVTPYEFPSNVMPPPTVRTSRTPKSADPDDLPIPTQTTSALPPAPGDSTIRQ